MPEAAPPASSQDAERPERLAYSPAEVEAMLGLSHDSLFKLLASGKLRSTKAGRRRLIPRAAVEEFLARPSSEDQQCPPPS